MSKDCRDFHTKMFFGYAHHDKVWLKLYTSMVAVVITIVIWTWKALKALNRIMLRDKNKKTNYPSWTPARCRYPRGSARPFGLLIWHSSHLGKGRGLKLVTSCQLSCIILHTTAIGQLNIKTEISTHSALRQQNLWLYAGAGVKKNQM